MIKTTEFFFLFSSLLQFSCQEVMLLSGLTISLRDVGQLQILYLAESDEIDNQSK